MEYTKRRLNDSTCRGQARAMGYCNTSLSTDERIEDLIGRLEGAASPGRSTCHSTRSWAIIDCHSLQI
jgi:hypothetical protein